MAHLRRHVARQETIIGLEHALLIVFFSVLVPVLFIIIIVIWHPILMAVLPVTAFSSYFFVFEYGRRNPDFGAVISEKWNAAGFRGTSPPFQRLRKLPWYTAREIYGP